MKVFENWGEMIHHFFFFCKALKFSKSENSLRFSGVLKQIKIQLRSEVVVFWCYKQLKLNCDL